MSFVSVVIPCRDEEKYIGKCLGSLILQDYPKEKLEILIIDGKSKDKTKEIIKRYAEKYYFIKTFENQRKYTPFGLNIGIKEAKGEIIVRADAHTEYDEDYVSKSVRYLKDNNVDSVGGVIKAPLAKITTAKARAIALCLSHFFGSASSFRVGVNKPKFVDTVFAAAYKRKVFDEVGLFNEKLIRSQDLEFNLRLRKKGKKILLVPDITFYYYPKSSFKEFFLHNIQDGIWAIYPFKFTKTFFQLRHYIPAIFIFSLFGLLVLSLFFKIFLPLFLLLLISYLILNTIFSLFIFFREKDLKYFPLIFMAFACRHFGYGLGSAYGLIKLLINK